MLSNRVNQEAGKCHRNYVTLNQPPLLDFARIRESDDVKIVIHNTEHKFAPDAEASGTDVQKQPIFASKVYLNNKKIIETTYGLPFIRFVQGTRPKITYDNRTLFTFNIHYHGLNTVGSEDGTAMELVFGKNTALGRLVTFQFPEITNNQTLLWFHSHNMFVSMELIYAGALGLLQIVDKESQWLTDYFEYGNNQLLLEALDMDLTSSGTQTFANLPVDENRSNFAVINGQSAVSWYSSTPVPFVNPLVHKSSKNLVKIDILNASLNWRVFHLGVCDINSNLKPFYLVQSDAGLINPREVEMTFIQVAGRVSIIIDLNRFEHKTAYLAFYNYDLTEVFGSVPTFPDQPNNPTITATVPDLKQSITATANPTSYPTPIPDPNKQNQQGIFTNLDYPTVPLIKQTEQVLDNGTIKVPHKSGLKVFLKIELDDRYDCDCDCNHNYNHNDSLEAVISQIRHTVFGRQTYEAHKSLIKQPCFEYNKGINYLAYLNKDYFYNLPKFTPDVPTRNILLLPESDINTIAGGEQNGTTEFVDGANRIMVDLWNSDQLNLDWALQQYQKTPNNYKPPILPTSKFRIFKTDDRFSNTAMISNDTLKIQFFSQEVAYGDLRQAPLTTVTVVFPPTPPCKLLNIQQWIDLVNTTFSQTTVELPGLNTTLDKIITCDWSFFPYRYDFLYQRSIYIKSAVIKTVNKSKFWLRLLARWPLLQFFGKPLTGSTLEPASDLLSQLRGKLEKTRLKAGRNKPVISNNSSPLSYPTQLRRLRPIKAKSLYMKCDEFGTYGTLDAEIQQIFPFYATSDGTVQLPIACMKRDAELIISPNETYIGLYDGYLNDNLSSFSVKLRSSEQWIYTNGDNADAHPLHFHLTSGFASPQSVYSSPGLLSCRRTNDELIYSRDIYQIGPQEVASFFLTWPDYPSTETTDFPHLPCIGGVIHCHFLQHNDANSMIIQYFVDREC